MRGQPFQLRAEMVLSFNVYAILAKNSGSSIKQIAADCDRDYYLDSDEAIAYGLADHIFTGFED